MKPASLNIPLPLWWRLLGELRERGGGERESGAFLLGTEGESKIKHFIPYDALDEHALTSGIVSFHGIGFVTLWNFCAERSMRVLADVHTHGDTWTDQSETDRTNPMIELPGHLALILPNFAADNQWSLRGVGIHEYLGDHRWKKWGMSSGRVKLTVI